MKLDFILKENSNSYCQKSVIGGPYATLQEGRKFLFTHSLVRILKEGPENSSAIPRALHNLSVRMSTHLDIYERGNKRKIMV